MFLKSVCPLQCDLSGVHPSLLAKSAQAIERIGDELRTSAKERWQEREGRAKGMSRGPPTPRAFRMNIKRKGLREEAFV